MSPFVSMPSPLAACHMCFPGAAIATTRALRKLCAIHAHSGTRSCVSWGAKIRWNSPASATHVLVHCENPISTQPGSPLAMRIGSFVLLQIWPTPHTPDLARCRQRLLPCTRGSFRHVHLELIGQAPWMCVELNGYRSSLASCPSCVSVGRNLAARSRTTS